MAPKTPKQQEAANRYLKENVEEFKVRVPKGEKNPIVKHAKEHDGSLNKFVNRAIKETIQRDNTITSQGDV